MNINVCIPAYNAEKTIEKTIKNLQLQSLKNFKILIYDDGSTDNTYQLVKNLSHDDPRISLIKGLVNRGRSEARNALLNSVDEASMIAWQDADDLWHPQKLHIQSKIYIENGHVKNKDIIYTSVFRKPLILNARERTKAEKLFGPQRPMRIDPPANYDEKHIFSRRFGTCPFYLQGTFGPASAYINAGGFDREIQWAEDLDIAIRLVGSNTKIFGYRTAHCLLRYQLNLPSVPIEVLSRSIVNAAKKGAAIGTLSTSHIDEDILWRKAFYIFRIALLMGEHEFAINLLNEHANELSQFDWGIKLIGDNEKLIKEMRQN